VSNLLDNQRLIDLVRHQRQALYDADLITDDEYAMLAQTRGAVDRLETYDAIRQCVRDLEDVNAGLAKALESITEALKEPAGGSYWKARAFLGSLGIYHDDLEDLRVLNAAACAAISRTPAEHRASIEVEAERRGMERVAGMLEARSNELNDGRSLSEDRWTAEELDRQVENIRAAAAKLTPESEDALARKRWQDAETALNICAEAKRLAPESGKEQA
jgi:hypothetical protein